MFEETQSTNFLSKPKDSIKVSRFSRIEAKDVYPPENSIYHLVPMPDFHLILFMQNGDLCLFSMAENKKIYTVEQFEQNPATQTFALYDERTFVYASITKKKLIFFDWKNKKIREDTPNIDVPTKGALLDKDRENEEEVHKSLQVGSKLIVFPKSKNILLTETKQHVYPNDPNIVMTLFFNEKGKENIVYPFVSDINANYFLSALDHEGVACFWTQQFKQQKLEMCLFDAIRKNVEPKLSFGQDIPKDMILLQVGPANPGTFCCVFNNNQTGGLPAQMRIYNIEKPGEKELITQIQLTEAYFLNDVYLIDFAQDRIIVERQDDDGTFVDIYNPQTERLVYSERIELETQENTLDSNLSISLDGRYLFSYFEHDHDDQTPMKIDYLVRTMVQLSSAYLHIMNQSGLVNQYQEEEYVLRDTIAMLVGKKYQN